MRTKLAGLIVLTLLVLLGAQGCSIENRRYLKGFHTGRISRFHSKETDRSEQRFYQDTLVSVVPKEAVIRSAKAASEEMTEEQHAVATVSACPDFKKSNVVEQPQSFVPATPRNVTVEKISAQPTHVFATSQKRDPDYGKMVLYLLFYVVLAAICPPLVSVAHRENTGFISSYFLLWALGVAAIIIFLPAVLAIVLSLIAWNISCLLLYRAIHKSRLRNSRIKSEHT